MSFSSWLRFWKLVGLVDARAIDATSATIVLPTGLALAWCNNRWSDSGEHAYRNNEKRRDSACRRKIFFRKARPLGRISTPGG